MSENEAKDETPRRSIKRIERVAKGETVIVQMMQEDLIDMYEKMHVLRDNAARANEQWQEDKKNLQFAKEFELADHDCDIHRLNFWHAVALRYELWGKQLGIRDDYCVVTMKGGKNSMPQNIKRMLRNMFELEEDDDGDSGMFQVEEE